MDHYDEIINLMKNFFGILLGTKIHNIDEFEDGQIFLESINICQSIEIPNEKSYKYARIEEFLDKSYKMKANDVVDFESIAFEKTNSYDDVISLSVLIMGICHLYNRIPLTRNDPDYLRLIVLLKPIDLYKRSNIPLDRKTIQNAISKALEKDFDDFSYDGKLSFPSMTDTTINLGSSKKPISDDEVESSLCIPSVTSETSCWKLPNSNNSFGYSNNDSTNDILNHDGSKETLRPSRRSKGLHTHRKGLNQYINSPLFRKPGNSPKLTELSMVRKQEVKKYKNIESDNKYLKDELYNSELKISELETDIKKLNSSLDKSKSDNRKLADIVDELEAKIEDKDQTLIKKDREVEKLALQLNIMKKEKHEKVDELLELKTINKELHSSINSLNDKLQSHVNEYDGIKRSEIESLKINQDLKNENERLKIKLVEFDEELQNLRKCVKVHTVRQDLESPLSENVEEGETMNVINEFKLVEIQDKMTIEIEKYQKEISDLKTIIENQNKDTLKIQLDYKVLQKQFFESMNTNKNNSKLHENIALNESKEIQKESMSSNTMDIKGIINALIEKFNNDTFLTNEKEFVLENLKRLLNNNHVDENINHEFLQNEITILNTTQAELNQMIEKNICENQNIQKQYDDLKNDNQIISDQLENEKEKNESFTHYYQVQKAKFDEDQFKLKMILINIQEENNLLNKKCHDLKRDLVRSDIDLEKSNDDYKILRERYDRSLYALNKLSEDCHDYEELIKEITEREKIVYKSISCQTEGLATFINSGTNVMSPRTPLIFNRSRSLKKNKQNSPFVVSEKDQLNSKTFINYPAGIDRYNNHKGEYIPKLDFKFDERSSRKFDDPMKHTIENTFKGYSAKKMDHRRIDKVKNELSSRRDSPLVKPDRINQILSRNERQPAHLKSSYPVETQGVEVGYMASVLFDNINFSLDDDESLYGNNLGNVQTSRITNSRRYTNRGLFEYNENAITDELLKCPNKTILSSRSISSNPNTNRNELFKKPVVPYLFLESKDKYNHESDRENIIPLSINNRDSENGHSTSVSFDILNSPKVKRRGYPRNYTQKEKR